MLGLLAAWFFTAAGKALWESYTYVDSGLVLNSSFAYARAALANKRELPTSVSLHELVAQGYLPAEKVNWGTGLRDVQFHLIADKTGRYEVSVQFKNGGGGCFALPNQA